MASFDEYNGFSAGVRDIPGHGIWRRVPNVNTI
jgi:hypothetical protein